MNPTSASAGEMGTDEPGNEPPPLGPDCWKTRLLFGMVNTDDPELATYAPPGKAGSLPASGSAYD